jgi:DNA polymerase V
MTDFIYINLAELHTLVPVFWPVNPSPKSAASPRFLMKCPAGFPSPAADYVESGLDLNDYLVKHRAATVIFDVCGDSMIGAGIFDGDKIVVDRAVEACHGSIIVAILNSEHTIKRLHIGQYGIELRPENSCYRPIRIQEFAELTVFGMVVGVVRKMTP